MHYLIYRARPAFRQKWRWKLIAGNGRVIATSGESFTNLADCRSSVELVRGSSNAEVRTRTQ